MNRPTVALTYGLAEGPWCSAAFRKTLRAADFDVIDDVATADCIVAHSGGHLLLPNRHYKILLLVAPSYGHQYKHLIRDHIAKLRRDGALARKHNFVLKWWLGLAKNTWYFANVRRDWQLYKLARSPDGQMLPQCSADKALVLVCQDDPWSGGITATNTPQYSYATYQGGHDGIWYQPKPFAALLRHVALEHL